MAKKSISEKRTEREQAENQVLRRVFSVFLLGLAAEVYLFIVYRAVTGSIDSMLAWYQGVLPVLSWLGVALLAGGGIAAYVKRADKKLFAPLLGASGAGLFLALSGFVITTFSNDNKGVTTMCVLAPIAAVLGLIFLLYQHECFLSTLALSGAMFAVWVRGTSAASVLWRIPVIVGLVAGALLLAAAAWLVRKTQEKNGKLGSVRLFAVDCDYRIVYAVLGAAFVCVLLAMALPAITYYLMWALGIVMFAELVLYTTKLM
ncbi:MAG: hypothetical protein K2O18_00990 [Oscillospiraceae bacterium]|nr:hypothetical protein [Oscillospiraceae bacterium]